jgi:hypothetical protein
MQLAIRTTALILVGGACLPPCAARAQDTPPQSASATAPASTQVADPNWDQSPRISASVSLNGGGGGASDPIVAVAPRTDNVAVRGSSDGDVTK